MESGASSQLLEQQNDQPNPPTQTTTFSFSPFVWKFLSVTSWILLAFTSYEAYSTGTLFFTIHQRIKNIFNFAPYIPLSISLDMLEAFILIVLFFGLFNYIYYGIFKKDQNIINAMLGDLTKWHFIPFLLVSMINLLMKDSANSLEQKVSKRYLITDLIFTILALATLGFIYFKTEMNHDWHIVLTTKKGIYSCLIILLWHHFFYLIIIMKYIDFLLDPGTYDIYKFFGGTSIAFTLLFGIGSMSFAFYFKDIMASFISALIYIGMINSFFGENGIDSNQKDLTVGVAEGVIDIILMLANVALIWFLLMKHTSNLTK